MVIVDVPDVDVRESSDEDVYKKDIVGDQKRRKVNAENDAEEVKAEDEDVEMT